MKNKDIFQGNLKKKKYFEGYYYKINSGENVLSVIVGVVLGKSPHSFIQILYNSNFSKYIKFQLEDFYFDKKTFSIKIKDNLFTKSLLKLNINEENLSLNCNLTLTETTKLKRNIMGFFRFFPFMQCKHHIVSMQSSATGFINFNNNFITCSDSVCYIEKDYGTSFPKKYLWLQGHNNNSIVFLSIATIPYLGLNFNGIISTIVINKKIINISTYNLAKIKSRTEDKVIISNRKYRLEINILKFENSVLIAPVDSEMNKEIFESNKTEISVKLFHKKNLLLDETFYNCGLEIVK